MEFESDKSIAIFLRAYVYKHNFNKKVEYELKSQISERGPEILKEIFRKIDGNSFKKALREIEMAERENVKVLSLLSSEYPDGLKQISDPPLLLFVRGEIAKLKEYQNQFVSIVGSRLASPYGKMQTFELAKGLQAAGVVVVSGLARGIDRMAHEGALETSKKLKDNFPGVAVLGSGVKAIYPKEHLKFSEDFLSSGGLIVSEYGVFTGPRKEFFPQRNRIISGLSKATCLIEAKKRSGARITARLAVEQGREVFALPGRLGDTTSEGVLEVIRNGEAHVLTSVDDVLAVYGKVLKQLEEKEKEQFESAVLQIISAESQIQFEDLLCKSQLSISELNTQLSLLEVEGKIYRISGDYFTIRRELGG